jgi:uncharacterized protein YcaQ
MATPATLKYLRRLALQRSLFEPGTLRAALTKQGFVQADPIRAPARAQDLTLRHRVKNYRAGDLEKQYPRLSLEEDFFVAYGFMTPELQALMHPRPALSVSAWGGKPWPAARRRRAEAVLAFVRGRNEVHPREVEAHFGHGTEANYWGGASNATTRLLDALHYRGLLRVARRENGIRIYAARDGWAGLSVAEDPGARLDALAEHLVALYAPLPGQSLAALLRHLRYAAPQWQGGITKALQRARERLHRAKLDGIDWYWPESSGDDSGYEPGDRVRLLAPFDPLTRDRRRFALFWGWEYRFEAYTPAPKRKLGYYALPLLWRDAVIGWANVSVKDGVLACMPGYVSGKPPRDRNFAPAFEAELEDFRRFLNLTSR